MTPARIKRPRKLPEIVIVGLGPAGLDRVSPVIRAILDDRDRALLVRTLRHPAADRLNAIRPVASGDDLYESHENFDDVYAALAERVIEMASAGPVTYAVPGSAAVGERSVAMVRAAATDADIEVLVEPGESFLELLWARTGCDPIAENAQILDGRALPEHLQLHLATVITQVDRPEVMADVAVVIGAVLPMDAPIMLLDALGSPNEVVLETVIGELHNASCGPRTSLFLPAQQVGWSGLVAINRMLRAQCPWDKKQTHHTLVKHLLEETYETVETIEQLPPLAPGGEVDFGAYAELEEELGDLLLQVVFHATLAAEAGAFAIEEVAEGIRRKLVARHPHVFGDVVADDAEAVNRNWEQLKRDEKSRASAMDDVPSAMPALGRAEKMQRRAAAIGFDWPDTAPVFAKLAEEVAELTHEVDAGDHDGAIHELGDVLFTVVNLARHLKIDPEGAFRQANARFEHRFRIVEQLAADSDAALDTLDLEELDALWNQAKARG